MFRILNRYALREIITPALFAGFALLFILLIQAPAPWNKEEKLLFTLLRVMLRDDSDRGDAFAILMMSIPQILLFIAPMALLLGVITGVGRMAMDLEVRAIQTSGANLLKIFLPIVLLGGLLSAADVAFNYELAPTMRKNAVMNAGRLIASQMTDLDPGRVYEELIPERKGLYLYFDEKGAAGEMKGMTLLVEPEGWKKGDDKDEDAREARKDQLKDLKERLIEGEISRDQYDQMAYEIEISGTDKSDAPMMIFARDARFLAEPERGSLEMSLNEGSVHILDNPSEPEREYAILKFKRFSKTETFASDERFERSEFRTMPEMLKRAHDPELKKKSRNGSMASFLQRFSLALQFLVYAFIGLPLAIWMRPSGKSMGALLAIGLIFAYHLLMGTGFTMVEKGVGIGPVMIFSPAILAFTLGWLLWRKALRS